ncbi:hypothetical protein M0813_28632 [Anaeramoeba flamelloides]|uniref:Uncharacterized protein n=1 Tax=Anaeramoeba flamelloides TaxID=1746091 RepID=A0ABQ8XS01_9EUKA|nr:hypothetical protein M0813_28632 [Anaeramoeba flamelloides]
MESFFSSLTRKENLTKQELYQEYLRYYKQQDNVEYFPEKIAKGRIKRFYSDLHPKSINASIHHINEQTINGEQFLILNTLRPFTSLSWSSPLMLNILQAARHIFVDGTFLSAPSPFTQLFIIAAYNEQTQNYYFTRSLNELNFTKKKKLKKKWEQIVFKYQDDDKYKIILIYFYNTFLIRFPIINWNYSILGDGFKHTNVFLENNNGQLNKEFKNRKPGLNNLIYILKKHEDLQSRLFNSRMNKELKKDKTNYYHHREIEDRLELEKKGWLKIQKIIKETNYFPTQNEKVINYKTINEHYDNTKVLKHRKSFKLSNNFKNPNQKVTEAKI